jgi:creatinine amidohydrolase
MKTIAIVLALSAVFQIYASPDQRVTVARHTKAVVLEDLTWPEAEQVLSSNTVVMIALGAAAKEHGPHLKLSTDFLTAEYLRKRVGESTDVVIAPTVNYHFYPAFVGYPGSTTLRAATARDLIVEVCQSFARFGVRRFYVLNTGYSTRGPLARSAEILALEGILLRFSDLETMLAPVAKALSKQTEGTHADDIETSLLLFIAPASVDMTKARTDYGVRKGEGPFTRDPTKPGLYSPTGIYGDPTLATWEKGEKIMEAAVRGVLDEIAELRRAPLPDMDLAAKTLDALAGDYEAAPADRVAIRQEGGTLYFRRNDQPRMQATVHSLGSLWLPRGGEITVLKNADAQVTHIVVHGANGDVLFKKTNLQ